MPKIFLKILFFFFTPVLFLIWCTPVSAAFPTDHLYTGQIKDDTGLYYYNARYYDPHLGIFTSADRAQGPNRYSYVNGNPIMRNDPTGNYAPVGAGGGGGSAEDLLYHFSDPIMKYSPIPHFAAKALLGHYGGVLTGDKGHPVTTMDFMRALGLAFTEETGITISSQQAMAAAQILGGAAFLMQGYAVQQLQSPTSLLSIQPGIAQQSLAATSDLPVTLSEEAIIKQHYGITERTRYKVLYHGTNNPDIVRKMGLRGFEDYDNLSDQPGGWPLGYAGKGIIKFRVPESFVKKVKEIDYGPDWYPGSETFYGISRNAPRYYVDAMRMLAEGSDPLSRRRSEMGYLPPGFISDYLEIPKGMKWDDALDLIRKKGF